MKARKQRPKFKDFKFEKPVIRYNKEYFDKLKSALDVNRDVAQSRVKRNTEKIENGEKILANLNDPKLIPDILELKPKIVSDAEEFLATLNDKEKTHPVLRSLVNEEAAAELIKQGPNTLYYKYVCHQMGVEYDDLVLVLEPTIENIVDFSIEAVTEKLKEYKARKQRVTDLVQEIEQDKMALENLGLFAQDPERTDLDYRKAIPIPFRNELMEQLDEQLMKEQANFENCMDRYKHEKSKLKDMRDSLEDLPPLRLKIQKVKVAAAANDLREDGNTLREHKEYLNNMSNMRNYFFDIIEGLPS